MTYEEYVASLGPKPMTYSEYSGRGKDASFGEMKTETFDTTRPSALPLLQTVLPSAPKQQVADVSIAPGAVTSPLLPQPQLGVNTEPKEPGPQLTQAPLDVAGIRYGIRTDDGVEPYGPIPSFLNDVVANATFGLVDKGVEGGVPLTAVAGMIAAPNVLGRVSRLVRIPSWLKQSEKLLSSEAGKELVAGIKSAQEIALTSEGSWMEGLNKLGMKKLSKADEVLVGQALTGQAKAPEHLMPIVDATRKTLDDVWNKTAEVGLSIGKVENYLPRVMKREVAEALRKDLDKTLALIRSQKLGKDANYALTGALKGKSKTTVQLINDMIEQGLATDYMDAAKKLDRAAKNRLFKKAPFEFARTQELPSWAYETEVNKIIPHYLETMSKRIADAQTFGPTHNKAASLIRRAGLSDIEEGKNAKKLFDIHSGVFEETHRLPQALQGGLEKVGAFLYGGKIGTGMATLPNITQTLISTAEEYGYGRTLRAAAKLLSSAPSRSAIRSAGAVDQEMIRAFTGYVPGGVWGKFAKGTTTITGFNAVNKMNQYIAAAAGKEFIEDAMQGAVSGFKKTWYRKRLADLGIDWTKPLTEDLLSQKMVRIATDTQLRHNILKETLWMNDPRFRWAALFKRFGYKQFNYQKDLLSREFRRGNVLPAARLLLGGAAGGEGVIFAKNKISEMISGEPRYRKEGLKDWQRYVNDLAAVGTLGVFTDIVGGVTGDNPASGVAQKVGFALTPAMIQEPFRLGETVSNVAKNIDRRGVGVAAERAIPDLIGQVGPLPQLASQRLKSPQQKRDRLENQWGQERAEVLELKRSGDMKAVRRRVQLWNKNHPEKPITAKDISAEEILKKIKRGKKREISSIPQDWFDNGFTEDQWKDYQSRRSAV